MHGGRNTKNHCVERTESKAEGAVRVKLTQTCAQCVLACLAACPRAYMREYIYVLRVSECSSLFLSMIDCMYSVRVMGIHPPNIFISE